MDSGTEVYLDPGDELLHVIPLRQEKQLLSINSVSLLRAAIQGPKVGALQLKPVHEARTKTLECILITRSYSPESENMLFPGRYTHVQALRGKGAS